MASRQSEATDPGGPGQMEVPPGSRELEVLLNWESYCLSLSEAFSPTFLKSDFIQILLSFVNCLRKEYVLDHKNGFQELALLDTERC